MEYRASRLMLPEADMDDMLLLSFHIGDERYVMEAARIIEIVPMVQLKNIPRTPDYVAGLFNYRGQPVQVIDLCQLTINRASEENLSTRIILLTGKIENGDKYLIGLIAERVTEMIRLDEADFISAGIIKSNANFLGNMANDKNGMIQMIDIDHLVSNELRDLSLNEQVKPA